MVNVPDPPAGSAVRREERPDGVRLSWPGHARPTGTMLIVSLAVAAIGLLAGVALALTVFRGGAEVFAAAGALVLASFLSTLLCLRVRAIFREEILVGPDAISWTPPASAAEMSRHFGWHGSAPVYGHASMIAHGVARTATDLVVLWRERESFRIPRSGVAGLRLEGRGRFEHLTIELGSTEVDVAKRVSHDDRAWLLDVLRRWRESPG